MGHSQASAIKVKAVERRIQAYELRKQGLIYREIGERMGCSADTARNLVVEEFTKRKAELTELVEEQLRLNLDRLDALLQAQWSRALSGDTKAVEAVLKVLDRQSRLLGLDAPSKSEVKTTTSEMSESELLEEARRLGIPVPEAKEAG